MAQAMLFHFTFMHKKIIPIVIIAGSIIAVVLILFLKRTADDARKVSIAMESNGTTTKLVQKFEAEQQNSIEKQKGGWQAILNNFKKHVENN